MSSTSPKKRRQKPLRLASLLTEPSDRQRKHITEILEESGLDAFTELGGKLLVDFANSSGDGKKESREQLIAFLDLSRSTQILRKVHEEGKEHDWFGLQLRAIKASNFTTGKLFYQRLKRYPNKPLFTVVTNDGTTDHSWNQIATKVEQVARCLLAEVIPKISPAPVAILSENCLDFAIIDLACLCYGIPNVVIPANSVSSHVEYILAQTQSQILFVSTAEQLAKVTPDSHAFKNLRRVICLDETSCDPLGNAISLQDFLKSGQGVPDKKLESALQKVRLNDTATLMYTSGTTQEPKGIMFSHLNIVSKRFARSIALPDIGEKDTFLCYLPLFHTFGRWFEMMGCVFWGSTYAFMQSPRLDTVIDNMRRIRPTVFISIPQKWIQLHDKICAEIEAETQDETVLQRAIKQYTGGKLRWGLSAAGFLDPEIFRYFQGHGIELMSGFGMTEATGGITMTPPKQYKDNSVGKALPGVKVRLAQDGEMMIKGTYVMKGYLNEKIESFQAGWFHTGDIFSQDENGFYTIIDRKKEIYKNVKGETIAPQKIENLFRDFEAVSRVYLVGDHRAYNTVLIYPNYDYEQVDLRKGGQEALREFFGSIIVSVNRFLAPYERIVDFAITGRDFDSGKGEITQKGTYKRKIVDRNFHEIIEGMYKRPYASLVVSGVEIRTPNWFLRQMGMTADDLKKRKSSIVLKPSNTSLKIDCSVKALEPDGKIREILIGDCYYATEANFVDLAELIEYPSLWIGNRELERFVGSDILLRTKLSDAREANIRKSLAQRATKADKEAISAFKQVCANQERDLKGLHLAAFMLHTDKMEPGLQAVKYLEAFLNENHQMAPLARLALQRGAGVKNTRLKREAFRTLILNESDKYFGASLEAFVSADPRLLNEAMIGIISQSNLSGPKVESVLHLLAKLKTDLDSSGKNKSLKKSARALLELISTYGMAHPSWYKQIRAELNRWCAYEVEKDIRNYAKRAMEKLRISFRAWLGMNQKIAVDPETAREYTWADVLAFDEIIEPDHKNRLKHAIETIPLIREAVFLFTGSALVRLQDISHKGIWVTRLGVRHGKSVYRVSIQTRHMGGFDLAVNLNDSLKKEEIAAEITWLICASTGDTDNKLVEDFGGYWPEYDLWTEEFIPGETVTSFLKKLERQTDEVGAKRLQLLWPYLAWSGLQAYVDFWRRTGHRLEITDPTPDNVIVPPHDYHVGSRIVSISDRKPFENILKMMISFHHNFVRKIETSYKQLKGLCGWEVIFSAFPEVLGEAAGLQLLQETLKHITEGDQNSTGEIPPGFEKKLDAFIKSVENRGFVPQRLHFAIQRFQRWLELNPAAIRRAQIQTLQELYFTYTLDKLELPYPGTRLRYFRNTVFAKSGRKLRQALDRLIARQKEDQLSLDQLADKVSEIRNHIDLSDSEGFFLTRMSYPHLRASDTAELISFTEEGTKKTDLVVFIKDQTGNLLSIRHPSTPKEIVRLHQLFVLANLPVEFRPEHQFLVVLDETAKVLGGLFYRWTEKYTVHLEKIAIAATHRRQGISGGLLNEFFNRLHSAGIRAVTVGFLRPEFFYRFGFKIDHRYGNMVKQLKKEEIKESPQDMLETLS